VWPAFPPAGKHKPVADEKIAANFCEIVERFAEVVERLGKMEKGVWGMGYGE
jgi:hypothetical protein